MAPSRMNGPARVCAACGAPVRPPFRAPQPELAPDLDMRPGEPTRSTVARWIATCPRCGACAPDLAALPDGARETVKSPVYAGLSGPAGTTPALRWALICEVAGLREPAAEAVLQAAWMVDDAGGDAAALRLRAAALWAETEEPATRLRRVDVLRRAAAFAEARAAAERLARAAPDENTADILDFQLRRIEAGDTGRHLISSALRPPARMPHVAHGPPAAGRPGKGLWARLFRG
jgi:hypothetical protein